MRSRGLRLAQLAFLAACVLLRTSVAQEVAASPLLGSGDPAWLSYKPVEPAIVFPGGFPTQLLSLEAVCSKTQPPRNLQRDGGGCCSRAANCACGKQWHARRGRTRDPAEINAWRPHSQASRSLTPDGYRIYVDKNALVIEGGDGWYDISVQYCDLLHGHSRFSLSIAGHEVDHWIADDYVAWRHTKWQHIDPKITGSRGYPPRRFGSSDRLARWSRRRRHWII